MMKKSLIYICAAAAMLAACDDDFTRPPLVLPPTVQVEPTTTVLDYELQALENEFVVPIYAFFFHVQ